MSDRTKETKVPIQEYQTRSETNGLNFYNSIEKTLIVVNNDLTIWTEIITEWGRSRSDIKDITSES